MQDTTLLKFTTNVLENMPTDWLQLTTHRLDIYDEKAAKTQFLNQLEVLFHANDASTAALSALPTAYDYIRLGHPLSCVLEWTIAQLHGIPPVNVIAFDSKSAPILAILRKNALDHQKTTLFYSGKLPDYLDVAMLRDVYDYALAVEQVASIEEVCLVEGSSIFLQEKQAITSFDLAPTVDFLINTDATLGSIIVINGEQNEKYIAEIQHVRRRETVAMTPFYCHAALVFFTTSKHEDVVDSKLVEHKTAVLASILEITGTKATPLVATSGLSMQYAIMMGLIDDALQQHPGKAIKFIVPPNCYGGTNDQARRVAACLKNVEIVDLPVDGDNDMVKSIDAILNELALENNVPYIIAEIPTNPRVEVPDLDDLKAVLTKPRFTATGDTAIAPVFILDQTFCPNVHFLGENKVLSTMKAIAYASGSKFPSGGKCTAGYCVANENAANFMDKIAVHLALCDNEATTQQYEILAKQLPSMNQRIADAYKKTKDFVQYIQQTLPEAKINFVTDELAAQGFTPSVFSLDLPTKGTTAAEKEAHKRALNLELIDLMINSIPNESKFCVSYGQLKGFYWTIPATSTQGTTKEGDKDYIIRASLSPNLNLELHKRVFLEFVKGSEF